MPSALLVSFSVLAGAPRTWERFRCTAGVSGTGPSCAEDPDNCISELLVKQHADILSQPEWRDLGYSYVNIGAHWLTCLRQTAAHSMASVHCRNATCCMPMCLAKLLAGIAQMTVGQTGIELLTES